MRIITDWQYKLIEKALYNYETLDPTKHTDVLVKAAVDDALVFFKETSHETMIRRFYFLYNEFQDKFNKEKFFIDVYETYINVTSANAYLIRREIIYRIAMNCYALGIFKLH